MLEFIHNTWGLYMLEFKPWGLYVRIYTQYLGYIMLEFIPNTWGLYVIMYPMLGVYMLEFICNT